MNAIQCSPDLENCVSDESLMVQLASGNRKAADMLLERYQNRLFAFVYRLTANQADAEDIFQDTWLRVVRYAGSFDVEKKFSTWLFQIAIHCSHDFFNKRHPTVSMEEDIPVQMDTEIARLENQEMVEAIIKHLPLGQREVLILRYFHDKKEKEIAELLGIPIGTVKSRLHKVLEYLKKFYADEGENIEGGNDDESLDGEI